ncbi:MAG: hypothetical protein HY812_14380 [Planctomycetes bacterium]|nr:hypothetical protein [Planctomycetota bacterium]
MRRFRFAGSFVLFALILGVPCRGEEGTPGQPDALILAAGKALQEGQPVHVWRALPASYQEELQGLVREFAGKMDGDVWTKGFEVAAKAVRVIDEKRDFIFSHPMVAMMLQGQDTQEIGEKLDPVLKGVTTLLQSDLRSLELLAQMDIERFLETTGALVCAPAMEIAGTASPQETYLRDPFTTKIVEQGESSAMIEVTPKDGAPEQHEVVLVDGVWVPRELADDWGGMIEEARANLATLEFDAAAKEEALATMGVFEGMLDRLLAAEDQIAFAKAMAEMMQMAGPPRPPELPEPPEDSGE